MKSYTLLSNHLNNISYKSSEIEYVYRYLKHHIATASMVSIATGVPQKNICRYKRTLEKQGKLIQLTKTTCKITGCKAWYLTTNRTMFKDNHQLNLFSKQAV